MQKDKKCIKMTEKVQKNSVNRSEKCIKLGKFDKVNEKTLKKEN